MQLDSQIKLSNLVTMATSQKVLANAADTLRDLGMHFTPEQVIQRTKVQPVGGTNILAVEVTLPAEKLSPTEPNRDAEARTAGEAKVAADVVANEFKKVYAELNNSALRQSREFIEAQLATTKIAMAKSQDALRQFKEESGVVDVPVQSSALVQRLMQAKTRLTEVSAGCEASDARVAKIESELKDLPEWETMSSSTSRDPVWQDLRTQLIRIESAKAAMLGKPGEQRRGPNHPEVQALNRQLEDVKSQLQETQERYINQKTDSKNPTHQSTLSSWISAKVDQVGAHASQEVVSAEVGSVLDELGAMPAAEAKMLELHADLEAATNTFRMMRNKLDEAKIKEQQAQSEVSLRTIDPAYVVRVNQRQLLKFILALVLSPLLGVGVAFLLHYTDNTIKTAAEAEKLLGLPVLCAVPETRAHSLPRQRCPEIVGVAYQMLTSNLWILNQNDGVNGVVVVSAEPNVGRSVTASNLAVSLAREGAKVVLVDADLRQPSQHLLFGVDNKVGLTNILSGAASLEDVLSPTKVQGLLLIPTGPVPENPVKLLRSAEMKDMDQQVKDVADFVIYDTPAGVTFPDPVLVAAQVGAVVVVHSAGRVPRGSEADFHSRLQSMGVRLLGAVLNNVKREDSSSYFHYRRSYQGMAVAQLPGGKKSISG
jgi:capsular exopolysaccharide synthesis family protein